MMNTSYKDIKIIYLLLLLFAAMFVRSQHMELFYFGNDQIMHMQLADGKSLADIWKFSHYETHPPLGHFIRYFWLKASHAPEWVRCLTYLCDFISIILFYIIGNRLYKGTGLTAATLAAFSPGLITLAQAVRNYSIFLMFLLFCAYFYLRLIEDRNIKWFLLYVLFGCLAVGTNFSGVIPLSAVGIVSLFYLYHEKVDKKTLIFWIAGNGLIASLLLFFYVSVDWSLFIHYIPKPSLLDSGKRIAEIWFAIGYPLFILPRLPDAIPYFGLGPKILTLFMYLIITYVSIEHISKTYKFFFVIIISSFIVWLTLCFFQFYDPLDRRNIWVAPFIIFPVSIWLHDVYVKGFSFLDIRRSLFLKRLCATGLLIIIATYAIFRTTSHDINEPVKRTDVALLKEYITSHIHENDMIVSARGSMIMLYFYILNENYYGNMPVLKEKSYYLENHLDIKDILMKHTTSTGVSYISSSFYYGMYNKTLFISTFENIIKNGWMDHANLIWFINLERQERIVNNVFGCPAIQTKITNRFETTDRMFTLFSINKSTLMELLVPKGRYHHCLDISVAK